jgi:hypothetical protein
MADSDRNIPQLPLQVPLTPDEVSKAVCSFALSEMGLDPKLYKCTFVPCIRWTGDHRSGGQLAVSVLITEIVPIKAN